jgi:hypothetical protein
MTVTGSYPLVAGERDEAPTGVVGASLLSPISQTSRYFLGAGVAVDVVE